jgi:hypothetical protein
MKDMFPYKLTMHCNVAQVEYVVWLYAETMDDHHDQRFFAKATHTRFDDGEWLECTNVNNTEGELTLIVDLRKDHFLQNITKEELATIILTTGTF